ncbi:MAG: ATP synthase F1 subunit gamma [Tenuifilaceae bacterium]
MGNLKEIRTRITSVTSTKKITSAMKMVSASKFKKSQDVLFKYKPFYENYKSMLDKVVNHQGASSVKYCEVRKEINNIGLLVISSNGSMCGSFNQNIIKKTFEAYYNLSSKYPRAKINILCIGKKGADILGKRGFAVNKIFPHSAVDKPNISITKLIFSELSEMFLKKEYDKIDIVYNSFKNAAVQVPIQQPLFPFELGQNESATIKTDLIIEPDAGFFIQKIVPKLLLYQVHGAILDSTTAEHGARMTAMHQATDNATDLLRELTLQYNKERQAAITKEILEIVSGANALKG